jgi:hypothetical protein
MLKLSKVKKPSKSVMAKVRSLKGHIGEVAVIEPISNDVFIAENLTLAMRKARAAYPGKVFYCLRIGFDSLCKIGELGPRAGIRELRGAYEHRPKGADKKQCPLFLLFNHNQRDIGLKIKKRK